MMTSPLVRELSTTVMALSIKGKFKEIQSMDLAKCGSKQAYSGTKACGKTINLMVKA